jgi:hypothetical protein
LEAAGAPGGAVNVLGRQRIGPFDAIRLAANDPTALATWLADKGFPRPDGLDANLAPYIAGHWEPLRLTFTSDKLIYPMRLSRSATTPQTVDLYVLAEHRMDPESVPVADHKPSLEFAGRGDITGFALLAVFASAVVVFVVVLTRRGLHAR